MTVSPLLVDLLWERFRKAELEFDKVLNYYIRKRFKGNTKDMTLLHIEFLGMIDAVENKRNEMIRAGNIWREFKRENESS